MNRTIFNFTFISMCIWETVGIITFEYYYEDALSVILLSFDCVHSTMRNGVCTSLRADNRSMVGKFKYVPLSPVHPPARLKKFEAENVLAGSGLGEKRLKYSLGKLTKSTLKLKKVS